MRIKKNLSQKKNQDGKKSPYGAAIREMVADQDVMDDAFGELGFDNSQLAVMYEGHFYLAAI